MSSQAPSRTKILAGMDAWLANQREMMELTHSVIYKFATVRDTLARMKRTLGARKKADWPVVFDDNVLDEADIETQ